MRLIWCVPMRVVQLCLTFSLAVAASAQQPIPSMPAASPKVPRAPYYIDSSLLHVSLFLHEPPAVGSPANNAELALLHRVEDSRTPKEIELAKSDDAEEDMFVFKTVLGPGFTAEALPITAALGTHVKNEQSVAGGELKHYFQRPRPFQTDPTLHPVCPAKPTQDSYPSGHALVGYLEALTLIELLPEKRAEILARADEYAHSRVVCGVHYPSDTEASRAAAYTIFGFMLATPKFQQDLAAARAELQAKLVVAKK